MFSKHSVSPHVESLEARDLMSAGVTGAFKFGVLRLTGTSGNDTITVRQSGNQVTVDGFKGSVDARQLRQIEINAGAGNDVVNLLITRELATKVFASGGTGTDALYAPGPLGSIASFEKGYIPYNPPAVTPKPPVATPLPINGSSHQTVVFDDNAPKGSNQAGATFQIKIYKLQLGWGGYGWTLWTQETGNSTQIKPWYDTYNNMTGYKVELTRIR